MFYLNTNTASILFQKTLRRSTYVDKSMLISHLNKRIGTDNCFICITRPRRFGKTINANMLGAYYTINQDNHTMFDSLAIAKDPSYTEHLNQHNVIQVDFSKTPDECNSYKDYINYIKNILVSDLENFFGKHKNPGISIGDFLIESGQSFIFIFDEWDFCFNESFMSEPDKKNFLKFLKGLLKDRPYTDLVYMTGILPVAKYSSGSELNMFNEYNFMYSSVFDNYFGFNEDEVKYLCKHNESIKYEDLQIWYNGYYLNGNRILFNPHSVCCALENGICQNYWTGTGPMNEIAECIEQNVDEVREDIVKMVSGIPVQIKLYGYSAAEQNMSTRNEILSAMVVYGFLSYNDGQLAIPGYELMEKYEAVLLRQSMGELKKITDRSKEMLNATLNCDSKRIAEILEEVHDSEIPFIQYNDENSLSCVVTLCYLYAREFYYIKREFASGKGYCDYIFFPKKTDMPAIILELKAFHSAENALSQIKNKNYMKEAENYKEIILVGINYDKEKHHTCSIEKYSK